MKISIAIVDDKSENRLSLAEKINSSDEIAVMFTALNGKDFLEQMKKLSLSQLPEVVLMDIEMPGMNGIEAVRFGKQLYPDVRFLMLTVFDDDDKIFEAIKAGSSGYLLKDEKVARIIEAVQQVAELEGAPMSPTIARKALEMLVKKPEERKNVDDQSAISHSNLSEREFEILQMMVDGYNSRSTAEKLFLSTHTVRKHIANIYHKLHVTSKARAIKLATKNKWI
jgi:DNA-binding NarL/FixJ family response regulator